jgi:chitin disaccharide deacetylase
MTNRRYLIVNSDDFGLSRGVNEGIVRAHEQGILTSASLMVRWPAAQKAADYAKKNSRLSVGLHVDLAEWVFSEWEWKPKYQVVQTDDEKAVRAEIARQLDSFQKLVGKNPTHIDSHQHVHRNEPVRSVLIEVASKLGVPLRDCSKAVRFCGDFYGQTGEGEPYPEGITVENLLKIISALPDGWTEVSCHAGDDDDLDSVYRSERKVEMNSLCDPRVRAAIDSQKIQLCSFADFAQLHSREKKP